MIWQAVKIHFLSIGWNRRNGNWGFCFLGYQPEKGKLFAVVCIEQSLHGAYDVEIIGLRFQYYGATGRRWKWLKPDFMKNKT